MQCPPYWVAVGVRRTHRLAPLTRPDDARERGAGAFQPPDEPADNSRSRCRTWRVYVAPPRSDGRPMCQSLQTWLGAAGPRGQDGGRPHSCPLFTMAKPALRIATLFRTGRRIGLSCFSYSGWQGTMVTGRGFTALFSARARRLASVPAGSLSARPAQVRSRQEGTDTMAIRSKEDYIQSIADLDLEIYLFGEKVDDYVNHPMIRPSLNCVGMTYELAAKPEFEDLMTATSHLTGKKVNRFAHIHQSPGDLVKKVKMQRLLGQKTGSCFQRCVGMDAINALYSVTWDIDQAKGTDYHQRFRGYVQFMQDEDIVADGAMTDVKGDRALAPHQQADPDLYLHIVERRDDGIVVRGAKAHQTGACNSHEIIVMPTVAMREGDEDYAVSFSTPSNAAGIFYVYGRQR